MAITTQDTSPYLYLEGNIGAGKSTFLRLLEKKFSIQAIFEPHQKWQSVGGSENLLDKFYRDTNRWAYTFQSYAFITRIIEQEKYADTTSKKINVVERSVYSDRYCFAQHCFEQKSISTLEWNVYKEWFSWLTDKQNIQTQGFIYLRTKPEVCHQRIMKRNRFEENTVSLDYLESIHEKHENWLMKSTPLDSMMPKVPILVLECNGDFETYEDILNQHYESIENFFKLFRPKKDVLSL